MSSVLSRPASRAARTRQRGFAVVAAFATLLAASATMIAVAPSAEAYTTQAATFSGLGCSSTNSVSGWGSVTAPANAVSVTFTATGGGGSGGDNTGGNGGGGGKGAIVTGTVPILAGQVLWAKIGCGGIDGTGTIAGYVDNSQLNNAVGGGGAATGVCIGTATGSCGGGTIVAVAGGGGGGGRAAGSSGCTDQNGATGGNAGNAGAAASGSGTGYAGSAGGTGNGDGSPNAGGGGGGQANGAGGAGGTGGYGGSGSAGGTGAATPVPPSGSGTGGAGGPGQNGIAGSTGGAGYGGGGGSAGGRDDCGLFGGNRASAGGGGGGSSWTRNTVSSVSVTTASFNGSCAANTVNSNAGGSASAGNQSYGCGGGMVATFTIGNPPVGASAGAGNATKGVALSIPLTNTDADGNNRTCAIVANPTKGSVTLSGAAPSANCTASYTANANTSGSDTFTYNITDSDGLVSATYTITVPIVNRAPTGAAVASPGPNVTKTSPFAFALTATDADGDSPLTCAITVSPTKGSVGGTVGSCTGRTYTASVNTTGTDSLTYTVSDAYGGTSTTYQVFFNIVNRAPTGANQTTASATRGVGLPITLTATDPDDDFPLTCAIVTGPTRGTLSGGTSCSRTYTGTTGLTPANDSFTYTVSDTSGGTSTTYTVTIPIANSAPVGANQTTGNANKGVGLAVTLAGSDADGDTPVTCTVVTGPTKGTISSGTSCSRTYTANTNQAAGNDSFTYKVTDSIGTDSATYTVTVPIVNVNPVGAAVPSPGTTVAKNTPTAIVLANSDVDGDTPLTCTIVSAPNKGTLSTGTSCSRTYTGNPNTTGTDSFTYRVNDPYGGQSPTYTVFVTIANQAPTATPQTVSVDAGVNTAVTLAGTDPDGDTTLTCAAPAGTAPTKGTLGGSGCNRTYTSSVGTANNGIGGSDTFNFTVSDAYGGTSTAANVTVNIQNPDLSVTKTHSGNFQPGTGTSTYTITVSNTSTSVANGTTTLVDTLPAGLLYRSYNTGTSGFTCTGTPGVSTTVTCTRSAQIPKPFTGSLTITVDVAENATSPLVNSVTVSNNYELAATAADNTVTDSTNINGRPTANSQSVATNVDASVGITLTGTDPNGDPLTYQIIGSTTHGTLTGTGDARSYQPDSGFQGIDTFTFKVTDTDGLQSANTATVTIYVGVGRLVGTVTNDQGGAPISGIEARLIDNSNPSNPDPALVATAVTNGSGQYDFASQFPTQGAVPYGDYVIRFVDPANNFISEYYVDSPVRAGATNVNLSTAAITTTVSAALVPGARIQGTVRSSAGGNPTINGLQVRLYKVGDPGSKAVTTVNGVYKFELLTAGDYQLWFRDVAGTTYISEWYDEQTDQGTATAVNVTVGQQVLIDETLDPIVTTPPPTLGTVTGTVRSTALGNPPIAGIQVRLYKDPYTTSAAQTTDSNGQFTFNNLQPGNYKIWYRVVSGGAFVSEYYSDKTDLASADVIVVGAGATIADAYLSPPNAVVPNSGVVTGTVTQLDGITPIAGIQVRLYVNGQTTGNVATTTDANGNYTFSGRAPGDYQIWFRDLSGTWVSEWYSDKTSQATADPFAVSNGNSTTVNAGLAHK